MKPLHIETPLLHSQYLKNQFGLDVYLKMECVQPPGSFKLRGIGALCQEEQQNGAQSFVASSGGNAGIAVAYCGMKLGIPTTVFIPSSSHRLYIEAIESFGAQVIVAGQVWDEAHQAASIFAQEKKAAYIPPFEHPTIWKGHASIIDEVVKQSLSKPDAVIASVGGGGLACGLLEGMQRHKWQDVPFIAVGTHGADAFAHSLQAKQLVSLSAITSKATSLGVKQVTPKLMAWTKIHDIKSIVVSDDEALQGCFSFAKDQRMLVELSSGASLSVVYQNHPMLHSFKRILLIVCGGINTSFFNLNP